MVYFPNCGDVANLAANSSIYSFSLDMPQENYSSAFVDSVAVSRRMSYIDIKLLVFHERLDSCCMGQKMSSEDKVLAKEANKVDRKEVKSANTERPISPTRL